MKVELMENLSLDLAEVIDSEVAEEQVVLLTVPEEPAVEKVDLASLVELVVTVRCRL